MNDGQHLVPRDPAQTLDAHQPLHGASGNDDAAPVQLGMNLARTVDLEVVLVQPADRRDQSGVF